MNIHAVTCRHLLGVVKIDATRFSEKFIPYHISTRCHNPENRDIIQVKFNDRPGLEPKNSHTHNP
jgi:hypothetical protein